MRDDSTFIRDSIHDVNLTMIIGGILTVLIVFVFLNSWRSTVITGLTLPISVIAAFTVMKLFGFTLNVMTLMGLSLAIGMLIDDAIVVRENIVRHVQRGKDHVTASMDGTDEIGLAVMATTFTIVAVFIPVAFMGGMVGTVLLRVRHHRGRGRARVALRELHPRPDAVVALGRPRHRAGPPRHAGSGSSSPASTTGSTRCTSATSACSTGRLHHRKTVAGRGRARLPRQLPDPRACWAATSCPTSTAASTRSPSRPRPGATLRETGERARAMVRAAQDPEGRRVHLHHGGGGGHHLSAGDRGRRPS